MFNFLRQKDERAQLEKRYNKLMKEWHALSQTNRAKSDLVYAEAQEVMDQLEALNAK